MKIVISPNETVQEGVTVMYEGRYWGVQYEDGHSTSYGYGDISNAMISDPQYCKRPEDVTYAGSYLIPELKKGALTPIRRRIIAEVMSNG